MIEYENDAWARGAGVNIAGVALEPLVSNQRTPLLARPSGGPINFVAWLTAHREVLEEALVSCGAILFRDMGLDTAASFRTAAEAISPELVHYAHRSTPRTQVLVDANIYTATEYPRDLAIPLHSENAYQDEWPMKLMFFCQQPAAAGGETPIGHVPSITKRIGEDIVDLFSRRKVLYVRNYGLGIDLPWQVAFQTSERSEVESYCAAHGISFEWRAKDRLRTRQVCQGVARHPRTQALLWFNQAHLFHVSSLGAEDMEAMTAMFRHEDLPRNSYYGDGAPFEPDMLEHVRRAFQQEAVSFPWRPGDLMLVDNMLVAHGRNPFSGPRTVLVAMAEPRGQA